MRPLSARAFAVGSVFIVMLVWGSSFVVTKSIEREMPPLLLALLRFTIACCVLLAIMRYYGDFDLFGRDVSLGGLTLLGLTGVTLYYMTTNLALTFTSASDAALIQGSIPAVTAALAVPLLGEQMSRRRVAGTLLSLVGVALVVLAGHSSGGASHRFVGDALMVGSVVCWSIYTILGKRLCSSSGLATTTSSSLIGTLLLIPAAGYDLAMRPPRIVSPGSWLALAYLGIVASALSYLLWNRALHYLEAGQQAAFLNLIPVVGVVSAVLFLGEAILPVQIAGGLLVLIGVSISATSG